MMKIIILSILFCICLSCSKQDLSKSGIIQIESKTKKIDISSIFKNIEFVPLETSDKALIGLNVSKIISLQNRIYLLNQMTSHRNILCFDINGNFIFKIDNIGHGMGEYSLLSDFIIDLYHNQIILFADGGHVMHHSLEDGTFLYKETRNELCSIGEVLCLDSTEYVIYDNITSSTSDYTLFYFDIETSDVKNKNNNIPNYFSQSGTRAISYFNNNLLFYSGNDSIYNVENNTVEYYINFGKKHNNSKKILHDLYLKSVDDMQTVTELFTSSKFNLVTGIQENDNFIYTNYLEKANGNEASTSIAKKYIIYSKSIGQSYQSDGISFDDIGLANIPLQLFSFNEGGALGLFEGTFSSRELAMIENSNHPNKDVLLNYNSEDNPLLIILK